MNCENVQPSLTALLDGELSPDAVADIQRHLMDCPVCAQARAELAAVRQMVAAWQADAPDVSARVIATIAAEDQHLLLDEIRLLRAEMADLRAEVAVLRRQLPHTETPWLPLNRFDFSTDYSRMETDPWNLTRS